jgi:hypothetical protein
MSKVFSGGVLMRTRRIAIALGLASSMLWAPISAEAAGVSTITIVVPFTPGSVETFTTTGGLLCPSGIAVTDPLSIVGGGSKGRGVFTFHLVKTLTCRNGRGTFELLVDAAGAPNSGGTVGGFSTRNGTGDFAGLRGGGHLVGTAFPDGNGITDFYSGRLTIAP